jgi:hypothetical protein
LKHSQAESSRGFLQGIIEGVSRYQAPPIEIRFDPHQVGHVDFLTQPVRSKNEERVRRPMLKPAAAFCRNLGKPKVEEKSPELSEANLTELDHAVTFLPSTAKMPDCFGHFK